MPKKTYAKAPSIVVYGVKYPLLRDPKSKVWRIRKRTKDIDIYQNLGVIDLAIAKGKAREHLEKWDARSRRFTSGSANLKEITDAYKATPKRVSEEVADANIKRLHRIAKIAWNKEPEQVTASKLNEGRLWEDYATKRHGGKLDLSTRQKINTGINSAIRMAVSVFHDGLHEGYKRAGIVLDFPAIQRVQYLPTLRQKVPTLKKEATDALTEALPAMKIKDRLMWRAIMLARFAGLRSKEIRNARRDWLAKDEDTGILRVLIFDREETGFQHKTGADYAAPILSEELEKDLLGLPDGPLIPLTGKSATYFYRQKCSAWLRKYIPKPNKTMHRLRALYLDHLRSAMGKVIRADQEAIEKAKDAAGHTKSRTTKKHYYQEPEIRSH